MLPLLSVLRPAFVCEWVDFLLLLLSLLLLRWWLLYYIAPSSLKQIVDFSFSPIVLCGYSVPMLCRNYLDVCPTPLDLTVSRHLIHNDGYTD